MRQMTFFEDPSIRDDIMDHISGYVFDRAATGVTASDEPMHTWRYASMADRMAERHDATRKRSVRR